MPVATILAQTLSRLICTGKSRRHHGRNCCLTAGEVLESRTLLAGNVSISLSRGHMEIQGDDASNDVLIIAENGNLIARGLDGTTVNGQTGDVTLLTGATSIEKNLKARMNGGDDVLTLSGVSFGRNAKIWGGTGNDKIGLNDVFVGNDLKIWTHSGNDGVWLNDVTVDDDLRLDTGKGDDIVFVDSTATGDDMRIIARKGSNDVRIDSAQVGDDLKLKTGNGADDVAITDTTVSDDLKIKTRSGDDVVQVTGSAVGDDLKVKAGRGSDAAEIGTDVTVGDKSKTGSVEQGITGTTAEDRLDDPTTGLFAVTDALAAEFTGRISPADLTLTLDLLSDRVVQSNGTLLTDTAQFVIEGTTTAGATVAIDADDDGEFDDGTAVADATGLFSITTTLTHTDANNGANQITVKATDALNREVEEEIDVHYAIGTVSRFVTSQGTFDVELLDADAPITVQNFLNYDDRYTNSIIHRSSFSQSGGDFVIQGGGFVLDPNLQPITTDAAIQNEFNAANSNVRGTLSMALGASPQSGTSQWFFNTVDNSFLDANQHTVFGRVIGTGMTVVDAIHDLDTFDLRGVLNQPALGELPLDGYTQLTETITGTVSTTLGSATLTGTGTAFTTELGVGQQILVGDEIFFVRSITSDTELTLNVAAPEAVTDLPVRTDAEPAADEYVTITDINNALFS